jgi:hypothetical protein
MVTLQDLRRMEQNHLRLVDDGRTHAPGGLH